LEPLLHADLLNPFEIIYNLTIPYWSFEKFVESFAWKLVALVAEVEFSLCDTTFVDSADFSILEALSNTRSAAFTRAPLKTEAFATVKPARSGQPTYSHILDFISRGISTYALG